MKKKKSGRFVEMSLVLMAEQSEKEERCIFLFLCAFSAAMLCVSMSIAVALMR